MILLFLSILCQSHYLVPITHTQNAPVASWKKISNKCYHNCIFWVIVSSVLRHSFVIVNVIVSFETGWWGGGGGVGGVCAPEQKAQKKFRAFHIVIRHSYSIPERFPREDYKKNELSVKLVANLNVSKILFVFKSKNNFRQCLISIEKKINK